MTLPPLVNPHDHLGSREVARYSRHLLLPEFGVDGQKRLKNSKVLVIGGGGLGSPALLYLAAAGVGTLGLVDFDEVDESNLQRQIIHGVSDIGDKKTASAARTIAEINPLVEVQLFDTRLNASNALDVISQFDLVMDGTDNFPTRYLVNDACVLAGKPYVWGSIFRFEGQASVFWEQAPGKDGGINYRDLYPEPPPPALAPSCAEGGVLGILCASIGAIMSTEAIKLLTGMGTSLLGHLLVYDALEMSYRKFPLRRDPHRKPITTLVDYDYFCGIDNGAADNHVPSITVAELNEMLRSTRTLQLMDVREKTEWDIVNIEAAVNLPKSELALNRVLAEFDREKPLIIMCKSGARSRVVVEQLLKQGYSDVKNLDGGIIAWIKNIQPELPLY